MTPSPTPELLSGCGRLRLALGGPHPSALPWPPSQMTPFGVIKSWELLASGPGRLLLSVWHHPGQPSLSPDPVQPAGLSSGLPWALQTRGLPRAPNSCVVWGKSQLSLEGRPHPTVTEWEPVTCLDAAHVQAPCIGGPRGGCFTPGSNAGPSRKEVPTLC